MFGLFEILGDESLRFEAHRDVAYLVAFAMHAKVQHAFTLLEIAHAKLAEFLPAQAVIQQCGEDGAITFAFEGVGWRCLEQHARLLVTERRREAFIGIGHFRPLHTLHGIVHHGVAFAEIFKQRRHGRELAANCRAFASPPLQLFAPGNQMRARHDSKFFRV